MSLESWIRRLSKSYAYQYEYADFSPRQQVFLSRLAQFDRLETIELTPKQWSELAWKAALYGREAVCDWSIPLQQRLEVVERLARLQLRSARNGNEKNSGVYMFWDVLVFPGLVPAQQPPGLTADEFRRTRTAVWEAVVAVVLPLLLESDENLRVSAELGVFQMSAESEAAAYLSAHSRPPAPSDASPAPRKHHKRRR